MKWGVIQLAFASQIKFLFLWSFMEKSLKIIRLLNLIQVA